MIASNPYYHEIIRKTTIGFGSIFSGIKIQRREKTGNKNVVQTINVPIALGNRDKWVQRTEQDSTFENQTYNVLPRISYELSGISYDPERKVSKLNTIVCRTEDGTNSIFAPVPYILNFSLYAVGKTQEDVYQIVEQILPYFSPDLTMSIKLVPEFNLIQDIPIVLNSVSIDDDYEGDFQTRRTVIATLEFSLKINFYGPATSSGLIKKVIIDLPTPVNGVYQASQETPVSSILENWEYES